MAETAITNLSERIHNVYHDAEREFSQNMPPWKESSCKQRLCCILYQIAIYTPMCVLLCIIFTTYFFYLLAYIYPLIVQTEAPPNLYYFHSQEEADFALKRGWTYFICITICLCMFCASYYKAVFTKPGAIPNSPEWEIPSGRCSEEEEHSQEEQDARLIERRKDGHYRTCKFCHLRKPDRAHHCKQCEQCVLVMDHHCNWIVNCVGLYNFKFFFLMVFYGTLMSLLFSATFWECVLVSVNDPEANLILVFCISSLYTFVVFLSLVLTVFFMLHVWLRCKNYTTIEFCEKRRLRLAKYMTSPFHEGVYKNLQQVLGSHVLLWPFPCCGVTIEQI